MIESRVPLDMVNRKHVLNLRLEAAPWPLYICCSHVELIVRKRGQCRCVPDIGTVSPRINLESAQKSTMLGLGSCPGRHAPGPGHPLLTVARFSIDPPSILCLTTTYTKRS